jgi:hypothetical protein
MEVPVLSPSDSWFVPATYVEPATTTELTVNRTDAFALP